MKINDSSAEHTKVITRFAPSPTGVLHVGGARTALFSWLFARKYGGEFVLRIEDTDTERSTKEYEEDILDGLTWLGLKHDIFVRQSEQMPRHKEVLREMIEKGSAYEAEENTAGTGKVIRFKNTGETITFTDAVRGDITFDTTELGDFVIARDIEHPLYHLAVVVDDCDSGITHVIRGEDGISNTPRQILIARAIGAPEPIYVHIPLILAPDKSKLSKRHGAVSLTAYRDMGYEPEALINFLALLGWNPGDEREIFSVEELIAEFSLERIQKGGAVFSTEKLDWVNKEHMKLMPKNDQYARMAPYFEGRDEKRVRAIQSLVVERISKWSDIQTLGKEGEWEYFFTAPEYKAEGLIWKKGDTNEALQHLDNLAKAMQSIDYATPETVKEGIWDYAEKEGRGNVLWPLRYALSGREKSTDPFTICSILGRDETLARIETAAKKLRNHQG
ncbi:MAG: glutamate--tRNA ligase [Parcubacteria group bacterium]|nr:glutamate--tRNA ligase [Parcubacteria group bacterium]